MNIDSRKLFTAPIAEDIKVGDFIHSKGRTINGWGHTWKVIRITPKQVHCVVESLWFPVFEKTAFGRVAKGEDANRLGWLKENEEAQKNVLVRRFWKDGTIVGFREEGVVHIIVEEDENV